MAAPTPARPLPGAFINTPLPQPVRRRLFTDGSPAPGNTIMPSTGSRPGLGRAPSSQGNLREAGVIPLPAEPAVTVPPVTKAAQAITKSLQQDEAYPDPDSYCRPGASSEYDHQSGDGTIAPFAKTQMYPIPDRIFDQMNAGQLCTQMGLFAEINHAFAFIDNALFLWDYTHPDPELTGYEDQEHGIAAVELVNPKPGVFVDTITHLIVVTTTADIILLGVSAKAGPTGAVSIALYQTKMSISSGGTNVSLIAGTLGGRIFVGGGNDTDVHEIYYQQEERWFSSRCGKINHTHPGWSSVIPGSIGWSQKSSECLVGMVVDDTRSLLYTLSNTSTIRTYHIEAPNKLTKVVEKTRNECLRDIAHMIGSSSLLNDKTSFVSISPLPAQETAKLHLMVTTNTGCRLFVSATNSASYMMSASSNLAPQSMQVQFVKFPPPELDGSSRASFAGPGQTLSTSSRLLEPSMLARRFSPGYFFDFVQEPNSETQRLFVSAPETGRIKWNAGTTELKYYEHSAWFDLGMNCRGIAIGQTTSPFSAGSQPTGFGNELAVQFDRPASEFAVMTHTGVHVFRRKRLVDRFASSLRSAVGDEGIEVEMRKFIQLYGRVETVSAALAVACGQGSDLRTGTGRAVDQAIEDAARAVFVNYGGQPQLSETDVGSVGTESVKLSSRHDALALYLARLIRSLWNTKVVRIGNSTTGVVVNSTVSTSKLVLVQENLERLRTFLRTNAGSIQGLSGPSDLSRTTSRNEERAVQAEHQALNALQRLMESISEGISFVLMLFDERVADIYMRLEDSARQQLQGLTYRDLFSDSAGKELAKLLVKAIVNRNIESGSNVETVADALRRRCGSFCSPDDVVIFKAQEQLQRASEQINNPNVARALLNESLRLFERVAGSLTFANLQNAMDQYTELKYYAGAIQICLAVAKEKDRGNGALAWINEGEPLNDPREAVWEERKRHYYLIHRVLLKLDEDCSNEPELIDGRPTLAATKRNEAYDVVNGSEDEVFHFDLYDWYIGMGWTDRIIAIESPHVVTFLKRLAAVNASHADLLCRFYTHRGRFFEAARVQSNLAQSDFKISIKDRITLLSRAKGNASVATPGISRQEQQQLSRDVSALLEVAHIQDDLLERLQADARIPEDRKKQIDSELNGQVQGLTELFNAYADQAEYYDLCLLIYHAADYHNPRVVSDAWKNLINNTHEDVDARNQEWLELPANVRAQSVAPPKPYEAVSVQIQTIAHRTSLDSLIFPIEKLLTALCEYALTAGQDASIGADPSWPILLFLSLGVPHAMVVRVLEQILDAQEAPFTGKRRRTVVEWLDAAVEGWLREAERHAGGAKGDAALAPWVHELMERAEHAVADLVTNNRDRYLEGQLNELFRQTKGLRMAVGTAVRAASASRFGYR